MEELMLRIALPYGSLTEPTLQLFYFAGIPICFCKLTHTGSAAWPHEAKITFMPSKFIPWLIASNDYDVGICGYDSVRECAIDDTAASDGVETLLDLNYGPTGPGTWDIVLMAKDSDPLDSLTKLDERPRVITTHGNLTRRFFASVNTNIYGTTHDDPLPGLVGGPYRFAVWPRLPDLVMEQNHLKELNTVLKVNTILVAAKNLDERGSEVQDAVGWLWEKLSSVE